MNSDDRRGKFFDLESSSVDSYSNFVNRNLNNFTTSSEVSLIRLDESIDIPASPISHNRTFVKEISTTIINAFTGKPISPNPWAKLCSKLVTQPSNEISSTNCLEEEHRERNSSRLSRRDEYSSNENPPELDLYVDRQSIEIKQQNTPLQRRRKKRNSLKDSIDHSSTSSEERIKQTPIDLHSKTNQSIDDQSSWYRLADVYTSEESDENNRALKSNINYSIRLKSEMNAFSPSSRRTTENKRRTNCNFLQSLSERVPFEEKHPAAKPYFLPSAFDLKEKRQELANELLAIFNVDVFSSQLSDKVTVVWSARLTATAGHCTSRRNTRTAVITLSFKVCDSPERCRDTLLHEMCHAAVTLIDCVMEQGHGPLWRQWTRKAEQSYPYLPPISVRHTYDVLYKFTYRCVQCQYEVYRHSKSLNIAVDYCGKCLGHFELIFNNEKDNANKSGKQTPKKPMNKYNQFVKDNFHVIKQANSHLSTPQIMRQLSEEYKKKNHHQIDELVLPDFEQLKL